MTVKGNAYVSAGPNRAQISAHERRDNKQSVPNTPKRVPNEISINKKMIKVVEPARKTLKEYHINGLKPHAAVSRR
jgi:hypothetical protein